MVVEMVDLKTLDEDITKIMRILGIINDNIAMINKVLHFDDKRIISIEDQLNIKSNPLKNSSEKEKGNENDI